MAWIAVNGERRDLSGVPLHTNLLDFVRSQGLTGAKEGCAEGECGACAVLVARPRPDGTEATEWLSVNACLLPAASLDGQEVVTAEGLAGAGGTAGPDALHPVQREMTERGGSQCGYCTPGFVCSMAAEYYRSGRSDTPSDEPRSEDGHLLGTNGFDLHAVSGNLCRCTGYRPIAAAGFALGSPGADDVLATRREQLPSPVVPTRLVVEESKFLRPATLAEALTLLSGADQGEQGAVQVVAGSTDWGVEVNLKGARAATTIAVDRLEELRGLTVDTDRIRIGAGLTLTEIEHRLAGRVPLLDALMPQFASPLIRNSATLGGNLGTGSPIGDGPPVLLALEASVVLASEAGTRTVALADYFTGYRTSVRRPDELVVELLLPLPLSATTAFHKIAKRRFDDISSVAVAYAVEVVDGHVRKARIGLGGVAATPLRALATEAALEGRPWIRETVESAAMVLAGEGTPLSDQRASAEYRVAMLGQSLRKFFSQSVAGGASGDEAGEGQR